MEKNPGEVAEELESSVAGMKICFKFLLKFVLTLISFEIDEIKAASTTKVTIGAITSPEIGSGVQMESEEQPCTILDWLKVNYQPPPVHESTLHTFEVLGLEYISSFEVDEEVPLFNLGRHTNDERYELFF